MQNEWMPLEQPTCGNDWIAKKERILKEKHKLKTIMKWLACDFGLIYLICLIEFGLKTFNPIHQANHQTNHWSQLWIMVPDESLLPLV